MLTPSHVGTRQQAATRPGDDFFTYDIVPAIALRCAVLSRAMVETIDLTKQRVVVDITDIGEAGDLTNRVDRKKFDVNARWRAKVEPIPQKCEKLLIVQKLMTDVYLERKSKSKRQQKSCR